MKAKPTLVLLHRWCGLVMAGFLIMAGITGSMLAWLDELEAWFSPELFLVHSASAPMLDTLALRERLLADRPNVDINAAWLSVKPGRSVWFSVAPKADPVAGRVQALANDQVFVDPYTGNVLGERKVGDLSQGPKNLMMFVYRLHYTMAIGEAGLLVLGIVALAWSIDCFVGAWLTLPAPHPRKTSSPHKSWLERWKPAWRLRGRVGYKLNFDLHRAGGLWTWAALFVLSWSSVAFNLPQVYMPVMQAFFKHQPALNELPVLPTPQRRPGIGWQQARDVGRRLMAEEAARHGFSVLREDWLAYDAARAVYRYEVRSSLDLRQRYGETKLAFDANTGDLKAVWLPTHAASGDTVHTWITALHMAGVGGVPMKVFVCIMGFGVTILSITGVVIWTKKRAGRAVSAARRLPQAAEMTRRSAAAAQRGA